MLSSAANKNVAIQLYERTFNDRDLTAVEELTVPGLVFHDAGTDLGRDGWVWVAGQWLSGFRDLSFSVAFAMAEGDRVLLHWEAQGTHHGEFRGHPPTGKLISLSGLTLMRLSGGKIAEIWDQVSAFGQLQALNVQD